VNVVDSSGWLEYFTEGKNARYFDAPIADVAQLLVPVICIYEVFKVVCQRAGEDKAIRAIAHMKEAEVVDISEQIALGAAQIAISENLAMADSMILATARTRNATLWTLDADFEGIPGVRFYRKR